VKLKFAEHSFYTCTLESWQGREFFIFSCWLKPQAKHLSDCSLPWSSGEVQLKVIKRKCAFLGV